VTAELLLRHLQTHGLLLQQDKALPCLCTMLAGEPVSGSWWAHPDAATIYSMLTTLTAHPDVLVAKLIKGKVTFVHRRLWPAVLAVGCGHEAWQVAGLSAPAQALYDSVEQQGVIRAAGTYAKELERRLLVQSEQVHTESGHHELQLMQWELWAARVACPPPLTLHEGRSQLASAVSALGGSQKMLPWGGPIVTG
jgi:hypothetical protein